MFLLLKSGFFAGSPAEQLDKFKAACQKRFPLAVVFADVIPTVATTLTTAQSATSAGPVTTSVTGTTMSPAEQQPTTKTTTTTAQKQKNGSEIKAN